MRNHDYLDNLAQADITIANKSTLANISHLPIDPNAPIEERFTQYLAAVKNPYCFRCGDTAVKINFSADGKPLREHIQNYLISLKNK